MVHRLSSLALVLFSLAALAPVAAGAFVALAGGDNAFRESDEGTGAHIFQLSIALVVPTLLLFLGSADWARPLRALRPVGVAAVVLVAAFATLYYFEHLYR